MESSALTTRPHMHCVATRKRRSKNGFGPPILATGRTDRRSKIGPFISRAAPGRSAVHAFCFAHPGLNSADFCQRFLRKLRENSHFRRHESAYKAGWPAGRPPQKPKNEPFNHRVRSTRNFRKTSDRIGKVAAGLIACCDYDTVILRRYDIKIL